MPSALEVLDVNAVRRWAVLVRAALGSLRKQLDALNVFPVPDGDTGTNLYLTVDGAVERIISEPLEPDAPEPGAGEMLESWARALQWSARGNSGVILSQLALGLAVAARGHEVIGVQHLREGLVAANAKAWDAVAEPREGTVLSVARASAEAARDADPDLSLHALVSLVRDRAREALERTPEQLDVLARAGVVDAGGAGLVVVLECLERLCAGQDARSVLEFEIPGRAHTDWVPSEPEPGPVGPEFEVMYLLSGAGPDEASSLRARLVELGDSVLVVGEQPDWTVHAHVDDAGAAVEAGIERGRVHRIRITRLEDVLSEPAGLTQHRLAPATPADVPFGFAHEPDAAVPATSADAQLTGGPGGPSTEAGDGSFPGGPASGGPVSGSPDSGGPVSGEPARGAAPRRVSTGLVACVVGDGLARLFAEQGAHTVPSTPGRRASTGAIITAMRAAAAAGARTVLVLPNDSDTRMAAGVAVDAIAQEGVRGAVIGSRTAVQGVAALAVWEPQADLATNVQAMQEAASATRHGGITVANRDALTSGGPCRVGDILGVVGGDIVVVGQDAAQVAGTVTQRLLAGGGELVTVLTGMGADDTLVRAVESAAGEWAGVEVSVLDARQEVYPLLIGVE